VLHLDSWIWGVVLLIALVVFLQAAFELTRRLLGRLALQLCRMRDTREGGVICNLKQRLEGFAARSLLPRLLVLFGSLALMIFVIVEHSVKL